MWKTRVYLPQELKAALERAAREAGCSEAELVREGIRLAVAQRQPPAPTTGILVSQDPHFGGTSMSTWSASASSDHRSIRAACSRRLMLARRIMLPRLVSSFVRAPHQRHFRVVLGPDDEPFRHMETLGAFSAS